MADDAGVVGDVGGGEAEIQIDEEVVLEAEPEEVLDAITALQRVIQTSLHHDGLARGLHEAVKALDRKEAHLCVLASNCEEPAYVKLVTALCKEHSIPLIKVDDRKTIGEWAGLCVRDAENKARKVRGASCVVIKSWGEETTARTFILEHIKGSQ